MTTAPLVRALSSVPESSTGGSACARAAPPASADHAAKRHAAANLTSAASSGARSRQSRVERERVFLGRVRRQQLALPFRDRGGGDRIADRVGRGAPHVEEGVDAQDQE